MNDDKKSGDFKHFLYEHKGLIAAGVTAVSVFGWALSRYKVAMPHEFLALTGPGITGVKIAKNAVQWPFQTVSYLTMTPWKMDLHIDAMTSDKQDVGLPITFTVGPNPDKLVEFSTLLSGSDNPGEIIHGIIEPEARAVAARLGIEKLFGDRDAYRQEVETCVQNDLSALGVKIWQSGVKEIEDSKTRKDGTGTKYFHFLRVVKGSEAEQTARQAVADMQKKGDVTVKENEAVTRMQTAQLEARAVETEATNNILIAKHKSAQAVEQARANQLAITAKIECEKATQLREAELQRELNVKNIAQETERERSTIMAKVVVEAEAMERLAQARLFAAEQDAKGLLAKLQAEAEGIRIKMEAEAEGQKKLKESLGSAETLITREMIRAGTFVDIAKHSAEGLQGLKPTIWTMDGGNNETFKSLVPYIKLVSDAVGIKMPSEKQ